MTTDKKQFRRFQILDKCFADQSRTYTLEDLMALCKASRATLMRDLKCIRDTYGENIFTHSNQRSGHRRIYRYSTPGFSISQDELDSTQLALIKSMILLLNKFVGKPQFEYLQSIIKQLENKYHLDIPNTASVIHFDGNIYLKGAEYLVPLFEAIVNQQCKQIIYKPFSGSPRVYIVHPYLLKEYNQRWYLLCGKQSDDDTDLQHTNSCGSVEKWNSSPTLQLRTLALDRIDTINDIAIPFVPAQVAFPDEDIADYFHNIIGITRKDNHPVSDVTIKCDPHEYKYISTRPIHPSQRPIHDMPNHIKLRVRENYELYQWLLFYGDKIEIISPEHIREEFQHILQRMMRMYE